MFFANTWKLPRRDAFTSDVIHEKKLYVGHLSFETTETELKELFGQTGSVETVRIITDRETGRSRGFGFGKCRRVEIRLLPR